MTHKKQILLSVVITIILAIILVFPFFLPESAKTVKFIVNTLYECNIFLIAFGGLCIAMLSISSVMKKGKIQIIIKNILITCLIFAVPFSIPTIGHALVDEYDEIILQESKPKDDIIDKENGDNSKPSASTTEKLIIKFDDLLFTEISIEELTDYKEIYAKKIYDELVINSDDSMQLDKGYPIEFEECVSRAFGFEDVYKYICDRNYFINNDRHVRHDLLNKSIELREFANQYFQSFENQRLIACRYQELATEYYRENKKQEEIDKYISSIEWNIYAFQTSFKEKCNTEENQIKIINEVIECYSEIEKAEILRNNGQDNIHSERARLLKEIFEYILDEYIL